MSMDTQLLSKWTQSVVDALVSSGRLAEDDGRRALARVATEGAPILAVLAGEGLVTVPDGLACLSAISGVRAVDVSADPPAPDALSAVPLEVGRRFRSVGYRVEDSRIVIACAEPLGVAELRGLAGSLERGLAGCVLADPSVVYELLEGGDAYTALIASRSEPARDPDRASDSAPVLEPVLTSGGLPIGLAPGVPGSPDEPGAGTEVLRTSVFRPEHSGEDDSWDRAVRDAVPPGAGAPIGLYGEPSPTWAGGVPAAGSVPRLDLDSLLTYAVEHGASDLHLAEGFPPALRVDGSIRPIEGLSVLDNNQLRRLVFNILPQSQRERFEATKELDTSHSVHGVGRFRVNVLQQRGAIGSVLRMIPATVPPFDSLGIPKVVGSFADLRRGLVLVTGPTGSGKSTTLASVVDIVNRTKPLHIVTVEDPIEFLHTHNRSIVNQREVGQDTDSFADALRHVLRQDPDVILVGELRDLDTISTALTAAETGHLVFATLHTQDAPQTIDRMIDVFPPNQQDQVRIQLAGALEAVVTQQLVLSASGVGRVPVAEVLVCTSGIRNLIRSAKTHQVYSLMQTGGSEGMQTMDQALAQAVHENKITEAMAVDRSRDPKQLQDYLRA